MTSERKKTTANTKVPSTFQKQVGSVLVPDFDMTVEQTHGKLARKEEGVVARQASRETN